MKCFSAQNVILFLFAILAICGAKRSSSSKSSSSGSGSRSSSSSGGRSKSSSSSGSGSSYPKQQYDYGPSSKSSSSSGGTSSSSSSGSKSSSSSGGISSSSSSGSGSSYPKQQYMPSPNYGPPSPNFGHPSPNFGHPSPNFGHPSPNFGHPSPNFGHPSPNFGQPSPNFGQPSPNFGQPSPNFGQPFPNGQPFPKGPPSPNFGQPSPNFGQPSPNFGQPFPNGQPFPKGPPTPNFGQPFPNGAPFQKGPPFANGPPSPNYGQVLPNYGKPSHNYGPAPSIPFGNAAKANKPKKSKTNAIVGAAVGAYAAHKAHKKAKKFFKKPKLSGVGGYRVSRRRTQEMMFLPQVSPIEWGSRPIMGANIRSGAETNKIIVHHTTFDDCYNLSACIRVLKQVEARNMDDLGYPNIGYNFMLGGDGRIYEGLGWYHYSTITNTTFDPQALQVAFIGDFSVYRPNDKQLRAFRDLVRYADKKDYIKRYEMHAHRDVKCTSCPGYALYVKLKEFSRYRPLFDEATLCPPSLNPSSQVNNSSANFTTPAAGYVDSTNITSLEI